MNESMDLPPLITEKPKGLRVLLVEDHAESAASMALLLRRHGHGVRVVADGASALEQAHAVLPDVVLLDIGLPGPMDGYEVARCLHEQKAAKRPLLIAVTGLGSDADRRQSVAAGIDLHLVKPADLDGLLRLLKRFQRILN
jgi:CheY-like chemotaxis protein